MKRDVKFGVDWRGTEMFKYCMLCCCTNLL